MARRRAGMAQPERTPTLLTNVRRMALNAAAYSREWYDAVRASMTVSPTALTQVGRTRRRSSSGVRRTTWPT